MRSVGNLSDFQIPESNHKKELQSLNLKNRAQSYSKISREFETFQFDRRVNFTKDQEIKQKPNSKRSKLVYKEIKPGHRRDFK